MEDVEMEYTIIGDLWKERDVKKKKYIHYETKLAKL